MKKTIKALFMTSRPLSWVNTAYPFATGYLVMGGAIDVRLIIGTLFWVCQWDFSCLCSTKSGKCIEKIAPMAF